MARVTLLGEVPTGTAIIGGQLGQRPSFSAGGLLTVGSGRLRRVRLKLDDRRLGFEASYRNPS